MKQGERLSEIEGSGFDSSRRRAIKAGSFAIPTIVTLHALPAWASTDYTRVAYSYGVNAGKCRNPNYNPNANPNSPAGQEFVDCGRRGGGPGRHDASGNDTTGDNREDDFQF